MVKERGKSKIAAQITAKTNISGYFATGSEISGLLSAHNISSLGSRQLLGEEVLVYLCPARLHGYMSEEIRFIPVGTAIFVVVRRNDPIPMNGIIIYRHVLVSDKTFMECSKI